MINKTLYKILKICCAPTNMAAVTGTFQHLKNALCQDPINTELVTKIIDSDGYEPTISNTVPESSEQLRCRGYNNRKGGELCESIPVG
jgi:hypothetical protein